MIFHTKFRGIYFYSWEHCFTLISSGFAIDCLAQYYSSCRSVLVSCHTGTVTQ